jgi:Trypsin-co-occurring domain 2
MADIGLADTIRALRAELLKSVAEAADARLKFRLGTVDLEFKVAIEAKDEVGGGIKFWVLNADAKASDTTSTSHTVKIQLHPADEDGQEVWTGDKMEEFPH